MDWITDPAGAAYPIREFAYRHGRHEVSLVPDFCGRPGIALGAKAPDIVTFRCSHPLEAGMVLALVLDCGYRLAIRVTGRRGDRVSARVLDRPPPGAPVSGTA